MVFMDSLAIVDTECVDEGGRPWVGKERQEGVRGRESDRELDVEQAVVRF